jgi:AcrR family transcriptional regulator
VAAAVAVLRAEGLDRVTMRRLAKELDTGPASLYVYVRDTADLHAAVLDELLGEVDLAAEPELSWRERLLAVLHSYTVLLYSHPSLAQVALVTRPSGPHYLALLEALLALLDEGGIAADRAAWAVDLLLQFGTSTAVEQGTRRASPGAEQENNELAVALRAVSAEAYPRLAALAEQLLSGPGSARLRWGFEVLLNGVIDTPRTP